LFQPIVVVHAARSSAVKQVDKEGKVSSEFDVFLQQSVEKEKSKEIIVETLGLLTQLVSVVPKSQSSFLSNSSVELTENIENNHFFTIEDPSSGEKELILQQYPQTTKSELDQILIRSHETNQLNESQLDNSVDGYSTPEVMERLSIQSVLVEDMDTQSNDQEANVISIEKASTASVKVLEEPNVNSFSFHYQTQQNLNESVAKMVGNTPVDANQFDKEMVKFVESAIRVQDLEDGLEAAFSLKPEHLGKVDVKVSIVDGSVKLEFLAGTQAGKDLLESHVQSLRTALETQGFQVEKINISQQQNAASFLGSFSQKGDSNGRFAHQDSKKRQVQNIQNQETEYRDFDLDSGSQINTTA
jgi:flagellar hook-length control protein FliK